MMAGFLKTAGMILFGFVMMSGGIHVWSGNPFHRLRGNALKKSGS